MWKVIDPCMDSADVLALHAAEANSLATYIAAMQHFLNSCSNCCNRNNKIVILLQARTVHEMVAMPHGR